MSYQLSKGELREKKISREEFKNIPRNDIYVVLDSLKCAHNIGTILRLADSLLVKKVYICGDTVHMPNKKIRSSSRGAEKWVPFEYRESSKEVVYELKKLGIEIVAVEVTDDSINYRDFKPKGPVCLVLGREYDGVSQEVLNQADECIHLPLLGMANSINVSAAASVALYDVYSKLEKMKRG